MYRILTDFLWDFVFTEHSIIGMIYRVILSACLRLGLDMTGFMRDNGINFTGLEHVIYIFAIQFIILKFVKKLIDVYGLQTDGDANADITTLVINFCKAMVIAMTFTLIWSWMYEIAYDFITQLVQSVNVVSLNYADIYSQVQELTTGAAEEFILFIIIVLLYSVMGIIQIKNGVELWILRLGLPLACVGILDADQGIFKQYLKLILKVILTIMVQNVCVAAGMYALYLAITAENAVLLCAISLGIIIVGFKTPRMLSELLMPQQAGGGGKIMQAVYMGSMLVRGVM
jgi:hypothetical protein